MKYISEYRDREKVHALARQITDLAAMHPMTFMEVCGTHTMALARFGIRNLLPKTIHLISGPGCPVCVTPNNYLDHAIALARMPNITICTFGDMMRVPGSTSSLDCERSEGRDIRVVYSTLDALENAKKHPKRQIIFLGVGFETTAPTIAASIHNAITDGIANYSVLSGHKLIPPALDALLSTPIIIDGFLLPGHVSAIIGANAYCTLLKKYGKASAIAGFEPTDILEGLLDLVKQKTGGSSRISISYKRVVSKDGNRKARQLLDKIFRPCKSVWRGLGQIPQSGLAIRDEYKAFDAAERFAVEIEPTIEPKNCRCGEILCGTICPEECPLFGMSCTPDHPVGACMVSSEGTCAAYYKYSDKINCL